MLVVTIHNDKSGSAGLANYECNIFINTTKIATGRIDGHVRADGWRMLLKRLAKKCDRFEDVNLMDDRIRKLFEILDVKNEI